MLHVDLDNILTQDELSHRADEVLKKADEEDKILVVTRGGRPAVAILKLEQLEKLSGREVAPASPPTEVAAPSEAPAAPAVPPAVDSAPVSTPPAAEPSAMPAPQPLDQPEPQNPNPAGLPEMPDHL
jgi:hypothetical protein